MISIGCCTIDKPTICQRKEGSNHRMIKCAINKAGNNADITIEGTPNELMTEGALIVKNLYIEFMDAFGEEIANEILEELMSFARDPECDGMEIIPKTSHSGN